MKQTEAERLGAGVRGEYVQGLGALAQNLGLTLERMTQVFAGVAVEVTLAISQICAAWHTAEVLAWPQKPHRWAHRRNPFAGHKRWPGRRQKR